MRRTCSLMFSTMLLVTLTVGPRAEPQLFTTHFFDWYRVTPQQSYDVMQRVFTFRPDWEGVGLSPNEVGVTQRYYAVQFRMIRQAGFDGIHYEWFGQQPSNECVAALRETGTRVAMFYDQEIRFNGRPAFIKPTDAFRDELIRDVRSFYDRVPKHLWLVENDGRIPLIFYGYQFDQSYRGVAVWDRFYRGLLDGLRHALARPVRIYWTDCGALCQTYAFQHFPEICSYSFGWWGGQRQVNAQSVTFVVHYDDAGAVVGGRAARTFTYDTRFLEENLQLARWTSPRFVFNYGWNEFYEGEHIFPDRTWGRWRLDAMSAIVRRLRQPAKSPLPPAVLLLDDLYAEEIRRPGSTEKIHALTGAFRYLFPQAQAAVGAIPRRLPAQRPIVLALTSRRTEADEARLVRLAESGRARVVFYTPNASATGPLIRQFASGACTLPLVKTPPPPANQWVGAECPVDVDANRYPYLHISVRNAPNTFYHVRLLGVDAQGTSYENHDNNSPLDWKASGGQWVERRENMKAVMDAYAGKPVVRFTGLVVIVNATNIPGDFWAEFSDAYFADADGNVGYRVPIASVEWKPRASFSNTGVPGFPVSAVGTDSSTGALRLTLKARFASDMPLDSSSRSFHLQRGVQALAWAAWPPRGAPPSFGKPERIPVVLQRGNLFWVNTLSSNLVAYRPLMAALGMPAPRTAEHFQMQVVKGTEAVQRPQTPTILGRDPLPLWRIRLYHPADVKTPLTYPWPATGFPLATVLSRGGKHTAEPVSTAFTKTGVVPMGQAKLQPGDVLDVYRLPISIAPAEGKVQVRSLRTGPGRFVVDITGTGSVRVAPALRGVSVLYGGQIVRRSLRLPCRVEVRMSASQQEIP